MSLSTMMWNRLVEAIVYDNYDEVMDRYGLTFDDIDFHARQHGFANMDAVRAYYAENG